MDTEYGLRQNTQYSTHFNIQLMHTTLKK